MPKEDPRHLSLKFKKVPDFRTVRVGLAHRALVAKDGADFMWSGLAATLTMRGSLGKAKSREWRA
jgi:hypothetical protein